MKKHTRSAEPRLHSRHIETLLKDVIDHLRYHLAEVKNARLQALLETSREVLKGLRKAYKDFDKGTEKGFMKKVLKVRTLRKVLKARRSAKAR